MDDISQHGREQRRREGGWRSLTDVRVGLRHNLLGSATAIVQVRDPRQEMRATCCVIMSTLDVSSNFLGDEALCSAEDATYSRTLKMNPSYIYIYPVYSTMCFVLLLCDGDTRVGTVTRPHVLTKSQPTYLSGIYCVELRILRDLQRALNFI